MEIVTSHFMQKYMKKELYVWGCVLNFQWSTTAEFSPQVEGLTWKHVHLFNTISIWTVSQTAG